MMMVNGRTPLLGSNQAGAVATIKKALKEPPGIALKLALRGEGKKKSLAAELTGLESQVSGRELLVGVAIVEDSISTKVRSGENAGKTLVEPFTVRSFTHKFAQLERAKPKTLRFAVNLPAGAAEGRCRVAVFVQDRSDGRVYQADAVPWAEAGPRPLISRPSRSQP